MTKPLANPNTSKSKALVSLEYALLAVCLGVIVLRAIFTEGPAMQSTATPTNLGDNLYSLSVSACLLLAFGLWLIWNICSRRFFFRPTGIEIGLLLFAVASVISCFAASDKRLAITNVIVFVSPLLAVVLLVQILDTRKKIMFVLAVIAALGVLSAYQCFEQLVAGNQAMIEQYEENPQSLLEPLGIEPGTLQQFLFEHRLYAKNVRAYFTTRNSAASFLLIAYFSAVALAVDRLRNRKSDRPNPRKYQLSDILIIILLITVILTKSKGAIIGLSFALVLYALYLGLGTWLKAHRKAVLAACVLLSIAGVTAIAWYGLEHGRLPGGNSMLVRWQYWHASAKMYANHPLTGVGPGNFAVFYPRYKPAAALESVSTPHNFPLNILTQYGPLGLVGFLAMIVVPLWKIIFPKHPAPPGDVQDKSQAFNITAMTILLILWLGLILVRLLLIPAAEIGDPALIIYTFTRFFIPAVVVFTISLILFKKPYTANGDTKHKVHQTSFTAAVLFCGLLGVLLHNTTDFAIFEPGVYTAFWAMTACLIAITSYQKPQRQLVLQPVPVVKITAVVTSLVVCWGFLAYAFIPVALTTKTIEKSNRDISLGLFDSAHSLLNSAAEQDTLSPVAPSSNARLYLHHAKLVPEEKNELLNLANKSLKTAIERNPASYKNYERLAEVYLEQAEISAGAQKADLLSKAFDAAKEAVERYPGCGRLHFTLAQIAEKTGNTKTAIEQYEKAVDIENQYRNQFRIMYPKRDKIISRIGEEKYQTALERIKELSTTP
jgi:O-antigen ligase